MLCVTKCDSQIFTMRHGVLGALASGRRVITTRNAGQRPAFPGRDMLSSR